MEALPYNTQINTLARTMKDNASALLRGLLKP